MIWKCLIVNDEPPAMKIVETYIGLTEGLQLAGSYRNAFEAIKLLKT